MGGVARPHTVARKQNPGPRYQPAAAKSGQRCDQLEVTTCFAPLLAWCLTGRQSTCLALTLDATSLGDRFTVLAISVVFRSLPSPWPGKSCMPMRHPWHREWLVLLRASAGRSRPAGR